jgi:hypothetical protein
MVGDKQTSLSPLMHDDTSSYGDAPSHSRIEPYTLGQPKSKFIRDIDEATRKNNHLIQSQNSKELIGEHGESINDTLRLSLKTGKQPLVLVEQGIRSGTKERVESGLKGNKIKNIQLIIYHQKK